MGQSIAMSSISYSAFSRGSAAATAAWAFSAHSCYHWSSPVLVLLVLILTAPSRRDESDRAQSN